MNRESKGTSARNSHLPVTRGEAHEDLIKLNRTRQSVLELLNYKRKLAKAGIKNPEKTNEFRRQAIEAINSLFNDMIEEQGLSS